MADTSIMNNNDLNEDALTAAPPTKSILREGFAACIRCGNTGVKDTFYGRGKQYCSSNCVKGTTNPINQQQQLNLVYSTNKQQQQQQSTNTASIKQQHKQHQQINNHHQTNQFKNSHFNNQNNSLNNSSNSRSSFPHQSPQHHSSFTKPSTTVQQLQQQSSSNDNVNDQAANSTSGKEMKGKATKLNGKLNSTAGYESQTKSKQCSNSFDWLSLLNKDPSIRAAPVSSFRHVPIADLWDQLVSNKLKVEVKNRDPYLTPDIKPSNDYYWIASIVKAEGYFLLLRFEGYEQDCSADFWINIFSSMLHPIGWSAGNGKSLVPPKQIASRQSDWRTYLTRRLEGSKTLPEHFVDQIKESLKSNFRLGMKLEVIDKKRVSSVRLATINKIIGNRLHVVYDGLEDKDNGFWCHQQSTLIHPIGWAMLVGHELRATSEYATSSLEKAKNMKWADNDADFSYFPHLERQMILDGNRRKDSGFKKGQKLEAIDPLNLSTICCATVTKVLRYNYLMVGIDGMMAQDGSDWFCYHASSSNIFPVSSCAHNKIPLTPPRDYLKPFNWLNYLRESKAEAAPVSLFNIETPRHGFKKGMYLEAVDLMEPRLICVAQVVQVVGRLLKIHFNGWDDSYDQWIDCESVEIYPLGWCSIVGYPLEPPKSEDGEDATSSTGALSNSFVFDSTTMKKRVGKQAYKGRSKKRKRNTLSTSDKLNGSNVKEEDDSLMNSMCADDQEDCSLFNLATESNELNDVQPMDSCNDNLSQDDYELTSNSTVTIKPSPLNLANNQRNAKAQPSSHVTEWSAQDVVDYFQSNDCGFNLNLFLEHNITGKQLIKLTREDVLLLFNNKLGPSLKGIQLIEELKKKY